jgi:hypothetical protein
MNTQKTKTAISIYDRIQQLLDQNHPQEALNLIHRGDQNSPSMKNAQAVCLLRLGKSEDAISILREITFQGHVCIPSDTPVVYQTNFAAAMLMANHKEVIDVIGQLDETRHAAVARIKAAVKKWEKSLNPLQRLLYKAGIYPAKAVPIDFPPGDLE